MAARRRTPFGHLVFTYRTRLSLTQAELAERARSLTVANLDQATVSDRTITAIEREPGATETWMKTRASTVRALAEVFNLQPGTPAHDEFIEASLAVNPLAAPKARPGRKRKAVTPRPEDAPPPPPEPSRDEPRFVTAGRVPHLERLRAAIRDAVQGKPGAIFLGANPGGGKTSLITHATREALSTYSDLVVLWGDSMGRLGAADPHQPFRQVLGVMAGNAAAAGPRQLLSDSNIERIARRTEVAATAIVRDASGLIDRLVTSETLHALVNSGNLTPGTAQALADVLETPPGTIGHALGINEQFFRILTAYATAGPTILVLEDLHWAEIGTSTMLFHLLRRLHAQHLPLLVLGSYRPSHLAPVKAGDRPPFPQVVREAPRLFRDPLLDLSTAVGGAAGRAFVDAMIDDMDTRAPAAFRDALFAQTAGLPLFVASMLRWYQVERNAARRAYGQEAAAWPLVPAELPAEIDALFADLVNRLPPDLQALLAAASVQGNTFSAEVLMQVLSLGRTVLIDMLDIQLTQRYAVIQAGGIATIAGERSHEFQFAHALLRNYLYGRMTDLERSHYHALTAEAMLALYGPGEHNGAQLVAYHFDEAGDRRRAARAYLTAGDHAINYQDYDAAIAHFSRIGELELRAIDPFSAGQALIGLGNSARGQGRLDEAKRLFEQAYDLAIREGLLLVRANALSSMGMLDFDAGRMGDGSRRLGEAIEVLLEMGDRPEASRSLSLLGYTLHGMGHFDEAADRARQAMALATDLRNDMLLVGGMIALANCWLDLGLHDDAIAIYEKGIVICGEHGNIHRAAICRLNLALCEIERAEWDRATAILELVFADQQKLNGRLVGAAEFNAGLIAEGLGDLETAQTRYTASLRHRIHHDQEALLIDSCAGLLRVATARGDPEAIRQRLDDVNSRMQAQGVEGVEHCGRLFVTLIEASLALDDPDCARDYVRQGIAFVTARADQLANPAHRGSYQTAVPAHRRLAELARELGVSAT